LLCRMINHKSKQQKTSTLHQEEDETIEEKQRTPLNSICFRG